MPAKRKDYTEAVKLYAAGVSVGGVAGFYGISRQAMYKILRRRGVQFRPQLRYGQDNHFYRGGSVRKGDANDVLERALIGGKIQRPSKCSACGANEQFKDGRTAIQAHHLDYNKPLDVVWLCQKCHHEWHKNHDVIARIEDGE